MKRGTFKKMVDGRRLVAARPSDPEKVVKEAMASTLMENAAGRAAFEAIYEQRDFTFQGFVACELVSGHPALLDHDGSVVGTLEPGDVVFPEDEVISDSN